MYFLMELPLPTGTTKGSKDRGEKRRNGSAVPESMYAFGIKKLGTLNLLADR